MIHDSADATTLVSTMISLAHSMRLTVVAEGVETEDQAKILRLLRCDEMQGYLFSKPIPSPSWCTCCDRSPSPPKSSGLVQAVVPIPQLQASRLRK